MKKLLYFVAIIMAVMAFASCENAISGKLEGKWRIITATSIETYGSEPSDTTIVNLENKFNYWEFLEDGTVELYYRKDDGEKKYEFEGTWKRNGAKLDLKVKGIDDVQVDGTIKQLTAAKLVFEMKQTFGDNVILQFFDCKRE